MAIVLGANQYGKAEVRMVYVDRSTRVHEITDVNVTSQLIGDFAETHLTGASDAVIATDTQKTPCRDGPDRRLRLAGGVRAAPGQELRVQVRAGDRRADGRGAVLLGPDHHHRHPHDHAFSKGTAEARTTVVRKDGDAEIVISGLTGLVVLKSTGSEFWGFPDVEYTSLVETTDRILATAVTARWL